LDLNLNTARQRYGLPADTGEGFFLGFFVHSKITR